MEGFEWALVGAGVGLSGCGAVRCGGVGEAEELSEALAFGSLKGRDNSAAYQPPSAGRVTSLAWC